MNFFKNKVFLEEVAINDKEEDVFIGAAGRSAKWGGSGIAFDNSGINTKKVNGVSIDYIEEKYSLDNVGLVKIDIEGGEAKVLESMKFFFIRHQANMFLSLHPHLMSIDNIEKTIDDIYDTFNYVYDDKLQLMEREFAINKYINNKKLIELGKMNSSEHQEIIGTFSKIK